MFGCGELTRFLADPGWDDANELECVQLSDILNRTAYIGGMLLPARSSSLGFFTFLPSLTLLPGMDRSNLSSASARPWNISVPSRASRDLGVLLNSKESCQAAQPGWSISLDRSKLLPDWFDAANVLRP